MAAGGPAAPERPGGPGAQAGPPRGAVTPERRGGGPARLAGRAEGRPEGRPEGRAAGRPEGQRPGAAPLAGPERGQRLGDVGHGMGSMVTSEGATYYGGSESSVSVLQVAQGWEPHQSVASTLEQFGVPAPPQPQMSSGAAEPHNIGSQLHHQGKCTPCKFFRSRRGCKQEERCRLCHFPHEDLTYSGIRKNMRRVGLEKKRWYAAQEQGQAEAPHDCS